MTVFCYVFKEIFEPSVRIGTGREGGASYVGYDRSHTHGDHHGSQSCNKGRQLQAGNHYSVKVTEGNSHSHYQNHGGAHRPAPGFIGCTADNGSTHHNRTAGEVYSSRDDYKGYTYGDKTYVVRRIQNIDQSGIGKEVPTEYSEKDIDYYQSSRRQKFLQTDFADLLSPCFF